MCACLKQMCRHTGYLDGGTEITIWRIIGFRRYVTSGLKLMEKHNWGEEWGRGENATEMLL